MTSPKNKKPPVLRVQHQGLSERITHVAKVFQVKSSKLGRLKVIRENLIDDLKKDWEKGDLSESVAYAFAKQTPEVQRLTVSSITKFGTINENRKWWQEWRVKNDAGQISKELKARKGPKGSCESCDATQQRLKRIIGCSQWDDHCSDGKCCHCCPNIGSCEFVSPFRSPRPRRRWPRPAE